MESLLHKTCEICKCYFVKPYHTSLNMWKKAKTCSRKCFHIRHRKLMMGHSDWVNTKSHKKQGQTLKRLYKEGKLINPNKGRKFGPLSEETKRKIGLKSKGNMFAWKGGRRITYQGYIKIHSPQHPHHDNAGYVPEHRLVMEKHIGRYLIPEEVVHHIDGNKQNNIIKNLLIFSNNSKHKKYHEFLKNCVRELLNPLYK